MTASVQLTIERVRQRLRRRGDPRDDLTPQEVEMIEDLLATGHQPDEALIAAVSLARWVDAEHGRFS